MYDRLFDFHRKPAPYSRYTAKTLWTDPHIAKRMLAFHLDPGHDISSRNPDAIAKIASWIAEATGLRNRKLCDLGCGPGLYAREFAARGADVTGCDFSASSIDHAKSRNAETGPQIAYLRRDYLEDPLPVGQDIVTLIYGDICALSPGQRAVLYRKVRASLKPGGVFILDAFPQAQFDSLEESTSFGFRLMDGFWSAEDYFGFRKTFLYADLSLALDRYMIVKSHKTFEVFNWMRYFTPEDLSRELAENGFEPLDHVDAVSGGKWEDQNAMFAITARRKD